MLNPKDHDLPTWMLLEGALSKLAETQDIKKVINSAAVLIGGLAASYEKNTGKIDLGFVKDKIQGGYDDFYEKLRDGKLNDGESV